MGWVFFEKLRFSHCTGSPTVLLSCQWQMLLKRLSARILIQILLVIVDWFYEVFCVPNSNSWKSSSLCICRVNPPTLVQFSSPLMTERVECCSCIWNAQSVKDLPPRWLSKQNFYLAKGNLDITICITVIQYKIKNEKKINISSAHDLKQVSQSITLCDIFRWRTALY